MDSDQLGFIEHRPPAELAALVSSVWVHRVDPDGGPYPHRDVPGGGVDLLCLVGATPRIAGPRTGPVTELLAPGSTVVGLRLAPGASAAVLGMPPAELRDQQVDADLVLGRRARVVRDSPRDTLSAMLRLVADRDVACPDPLAASLVRLLMSGRGDVDELTSPLNASERHLRRVCRAATGLAPKELHRILRFQRFLAHVQFELSHGRDPVGGLARLAADAGYADQAHLTHECTRLAGVTPREFVGQTRHQCGPTHDHRASVRVHLSMAGLIN